jgi:hypothetical protein
MTCTSSNQTLDTDVVDGVAYLRTVRDELAHNAAITADQLHPQMLRRDSFCLDTEILGLNVQVDYPDDVLDTLTAGLDVYDDAQ